MDREIFFAVSAVLIEVGYPEPQEVQARRLKVEQGPKGLQS
jgi:hypothetical protein